ncbi:MAG: glycosyltransferase, partial [Coriobacteriales bacterium]|nr:glycosyltransferase [Coriobacteriales bacterium]
MNSAADTVITFALPCYNAADYMDHCVESILEAASDYLDRTQIVIVDDGS